MNHVAAILALVLVAACGSEVRRSGPTRLADGTRIDPAPHEPIRAESGDLAALEAHAGEDAPRYDGPPLSAELVGLGPRAEGAPSAPTLEVAVRAPSGGWSLAADEVELEGGHTARVRLMLTEPGRDAGVTEAMETLRASVAVPADVRAVHVFVSRWIEGVQYVQAPPYALAAVLRVPHRTR
jgi:hypothetical protein